LQPLKAATVGLSMATFKAIFEKGISIANIHFSQEKHKYYTTFFVPSRTSSELTNKFREDITLLLASSLCRQKDIADALEMDESNLSHLRYRRPPGKKILAKFEKLFGDEVDSIRKKLIADKETSIVKEPIYPYNTEYQKLEGRVEDQIQRLEARIATLERKLALSNAFRIKMLKKIKRVK